MDWKSIEGKTIKTATPMKKPGYDDEAWCVLEFTDGTQRVAVAGFSGYTGRSEDEYPCHVYLRSHVDGLVPVDPKADVASDEDLGAPGRHLRVERCGDPVPLVDLPPGLFVDASGCVGFKTEYHAADRFLMEVYCVESGEVYWGGVGSASARAVLLACPAKLVPDRQ